MLLQKGEKNQSEAAITFCNGSVHRGQQGVLLPVSLALVQHLYLTEDTAAAVTWSLLDDLQEKSAIYKYSTTQTCLACMFHCCGG